MNYVVSIPNGYYNQQPTNEDIMLPTDLQDIYEQLTKTVSDETLIKCRQSGIKSATDKWLLQVKSATDECLLQDILSWKDDCVRELRASIRQHKHLCAEDKLSQAKNIIHNYYYCLTLTLRYKNKTFYQLFCSIFNETV